MYVVRESRPEDIPAIADLMRAYMHETYAAGWSGGTIELLRDGFGSKFRLLVAEQETRAVGLVAWEKSYDLHHCLSGGHVLDLYVAQDHRHQGLAVQLIALASKIIYSEGGAFIKGGAVDNGTGARLYGRFAPAFGNDYILGGKAFRHLAGLPELSVRTLARCMPNKDWNFEP
jgi:GNAT superfamily N-acetyltransferase